MWDAIPLSGVVTVARVVAGPEMMDAVQRASQEGRAARRAWPEQ
ncbi:hypothetical protein GGQ19_001685 [Salinibacter ruber]|nr:hypothetical protein [Salinibacter ruber]MCS3750516.1 hypothetical protein [Salinibacter ruber]